MWRKKLEIFGKKILKNRDLFFEKIFSHYNVLWITSDVSSGSLIPKFNLQWSKIVHQKAPCQKMSLAVTSTYGSIRKFRPPDPGFWSITNPMVMVSTPNSNVENRNLAIGAPLTDTGGQTKPKRPLESEFEVWSRASMLLVWSCFSNLCKKNFWTHFLIFLQTRIT